MSDHRGFNVAHDAAMSALTDAKNAQFENRRLSERVQTLEQQVKVLQQQVEELRRTRMPSS